MKVSLYFFAAVLMLTGAGEILACTCMHLGSYQTPDQQLIDKKRESANAVFSGKVIKIVLPKQSKDKITTSLKVYIRVVEVWKGVTRENVVVTTPKDSSFCGYPFKLNEKYLIYAYRYKKEDLSTSLCERTTILENAEEDIEFLGEAVKTFGEKKNKK
jgi:hypothetical protein